MNETITRVVTGIISGVFFLWSYFYSVHSFSTLLLIILGIILFFEWPRLCNKNKQLWFLTPIYPVLPVILLIYFNYAYRPIDIFFPLYPFFISWAADTGGYIFGVLFGKYKICSRISPKKTWEGLFGSFSFVFFVNLLLVIKRPAFVLFGLSKSLFLLILISVVLTGIAFLGDIFISFLKRKAKIKDTGTLLPGHGGLLDRFDSVFFVVVVVFLIRIFFL